MNYKIEHLLSELPMFGAMLIIFICYTLVLKDIGILDFAILATCLYLIYYRYQRLKQLWSYVESINRDVSYNNVMTINLNVLKKINSGGEIEIKSNEQNGGVR